MVELNEKQINNRVKWVRGLLSGNFKQGSRALKRRPTVDSKDVSYCCLGVACELINPESSSLMLDWTGGTMSEALMVAGFAFSAFGMSTSDQTTAATWNDSGGYTFTRIADFVAYATQHSFLFEVFATSKVPYGYATEWLRQFDGD